MQGLYWKKIALGLLVPGILGLAISQPVDEDYVSPDHDFMIGTNEQEYEVVPIHKSDIQKRSIDGRFHLQLTAFGEHIKLWLEPQVGVLATTNTPIFHVDAKGRIAEVPGFMKKIAAKMYVNEREAATMYIKKTPSGAYKLDGIIGGKGYAIHSTSDPSAGANEIWHRSDRFKRFLDTIPEHERGNYSYHIVTKLSQKPSQLQSFKERIVTLNSTRSKRSIDAGVVYPEIMVVADYPFCKKFRLSDYETVKYLLAFWNSVDFNFRSLENPKFRLNIAGILIAKAPTSLSYMQHITPSYPYDLMHTLALRDSAHFILKLDQEYRKTHSFDLLVTLTSTHLCEVEHGICKRGTLGVSYLAKACSPPVMGWSQRGKVPVNGFNTAIVHDNADYRGVQVASHELGHLFGAQHDGEENEECSHHIGNIMAPAVAHTTNSSDWSYCSVINMNYFLNSHFSKCLYNKPQPGTKLARFLPGKILDADAQCRAQGQYKASQYNDDICMKLRCINHQRTLIFNYPGAADGTTCGKNKICLHRQCIDLSTITV